MEKCDYYVSTSKMDKVELKNLCDGCIYNNDYRLCPMDFEEKFGLIDSDWGEWD